ncbi:MAG: hypothetical protein AAGH90_09610 [Pseudomonadota bacterium]
MSADLVSEPLWKAIDEAGLADRFDERGYARVDCPSCGAGAGLKLSLGRGRVSCGACGLEGALLTYLRERESAVALLDEPCAPAEIIVFDPERSQRALARQIARDDDTMIVDAEVVQPRPVEQGRRQDSGRGQEKGGGIERLIMTLLALLFLMAGLAAAGLSGFANFQAFSGGVADPLQARIWGWAGVIASVCSFGGFTFFWWHMSGKRRAEALRALVFALAGAATSLAGTAMFIDNNAAVDQAEREQITASRSVIEAQIEDWSHQLAGIPAQTRSVEGLEAYLAGVEAAGRTHQKPYRDAQNELGLARRRAGLERDIAEARASLVGKGTLDVSVRAQRQSLPGWVFALMLEVFSSQGTSIALVSLLLLYGPASSETRSEADHEGALVT